MNAAAARHRDPEKLLKKRASPAAIRDIPGNPAFLHLMAN